MDITTATQRDRDAVLSLSDMDLEVPATDQYYTLVLSKTLRNQGLLFTLLTQSTRNVYVIIFSLIWSTFTVYVLPNGAKGSGNYGSSSNA